MRRLLIKFPKLTGPLRSYYNMFFGEKEIKFLNNYLKINKLDYLFIDVGANYGIYTFLFGPQSIFSFIIEPIYECIEYIKSGYSNQNIKFINKVASDDNAIKSLSIPLEGNKKIFGRSSLSKSFDNFIKLDIDSIRLDELIEEVTTQIEQVNLNTSTTAIPYTEEQQERERIFHPKQGLISHQTIQKLRETQLRISAV